MTAAKIKRQRAKSKRGGADTVGRAGQVGDLRRRREAIFAGRGGGEPARRKYGGKYRYRCTVCQAAVVRLAETPGAGRFGNMTAVGIRAPGGADQDVGGRRAYFLGTRMPTTVNSEKLYIVSNSAMGRAKR